MKTLNSLQQKAYHEAVNQRRSLLITGAGGVGKSYTVEKIISDLRSQGKNVAITASTGAAALLIGGTTVHRWSGCGTFNRSAETIATSILQSQSRNDVRDRWRNTQVLVIDEISMLDAYVLDTLEHVARIVRRNPTHFGGLQVILVGDFLQLPPVKPRGGFAFDAKCWPKIIGRDGCIELIENVRQSEIHFQKALSEIRMGIVSRETIRLLRSRVDAKVGTDLIKPTKLYPHRKSVDNENNRELEKLKTPLFVFNALHKWSPHEPKNADKLIEKENNNYQARRILQLKVGAQVMLIVNLSDQLVNGSRGVVVGFSGRTPIVQFLHGSPIPIQPQRWRSKVRDNLWLERTQIPLILAYACTIHKVQGATLDCAEISIGSCFDPGHAYVALSRVRSIGGLSLRGKDLSRIKSSRKVLEFYNAIRANQQTAAIRAPQPESPKRQRVKVKKESGEGQSSTTKMKLIVLQQSKKRKKTN